MLSNLDEVYERSLQLISEYETSLAEIRYKKALKFGLYNEAKLNRLMAEYTPGDWLRPTDECDEDSTEYLIARQLAYVMCKIKLLATSKDKTDRHYYQLSLDAGSESLWRIAESHGLVGGEQKAFLIEMLRYTTSEKAISGYIQGKRKRRCK